ncbi:hypothetical protein BH10PLA1_BH10PLA1_21630 [soil metagenome]
MKTRWSAEQANKWYAALPWLVGCNYTPRNASNQLEMWQPETFSPDVIAEELQWAAAIGMNSIRISLHDLAWKESPRNFLSRVDRVLSIAHKLGIAALVVFFDSVWHPFPRTGPQREPEPGVHNAGWVQSPGVAVLRDEAQFNALEPYVTQVIEHFADDSRIQGWDLWNEPENSNGSSYGPRDLGPEKEQVATKYLPSVFDWARRAMPSQPLTSGVWAGNWTSEQTMRPLERLQIELSDVISFHCYGPPADMEKKILQLQQFGRPLICTEYMARPTGSTFQSILPILKKHHVAAYNWGLVDGRTQTKFPWDSWKTLYEADPTPWFHEVFRADGTPYSAEEVAVVKQLTMPRP